MNPVCLAALLFAIPSFCWANGSEEVDSLADRPIAYMVGQDRCEMIGAVIVGGEAVSGATITLQKGDAIVAKARTVKLNVSETIYPAGLRELLQHGEKGRATGTLVGVSGGRSVSPRRLAAKFLALHEKPRIFQEWLRHS